MLVKIPMAYGPNSFHTGIRPYNAFQPPKKAFRQLSEVLLRRETMQDPTSSVWSLSLCHLQKSRFTFFGISISARFGWIYSLALISLFFLFVPHSFSPNITNSFLGLTSTVSYLPNRLPGSQKPVQPLTGRRIDVGATWKYRFWSDLFPLHVSCCSGFDVLKNEICESVLFLEGSNRLIDVMVQKVCFIQKMRSREIFEISVLFQAMAAGCSFSPRAP